MNFKLVHQTSCKVVQAKAFSRLEQHDATTDHVRLKETVVSKLDMNFGCLWTRLAIFLLLVCATMPLKAAVTPGTTFSFTLDEPCKTSAGVYLTNGTLVRTLWSKATYYAAGTYSAVWDGLDDNSNAVAAGTYQIKLLQHNTEYVWDGAIGNTSAQMSGPTVHTGFHPMRDMAIAGTNAFYVSGYSEGKYDFRSFLTTAPQSVTASWGPYGGGPANVYDPNWNWTATDGNWVYFACVSTLAPTNTAINYPGCVVSFNVSNLSSAPFSNGVMVTNGPNTPFAGIYVGTQPGLSGLAVQQSGSLLAVSVSLDNLVYLMDKHSGVGTATISVPSPGGLSFSPDGSLWVISGNSVIQYTELNSNPSATKTIPNFINPLAVAVNPANSNLILVADGGFNGNGGGSQQIKAFNSAGTSLWTYGLPGGYASNGVAVASNKFWFFDGQYDATFLCFAPDGSFWVGDGGNHRSLHFSAACSYLEQIMYQTLSYRTCAAQNNYSRVFNQFLEFEVDYTKPLSQSWTLVNNWQANVPTNNISGSAGLFNVTTFPNGRTYALIDNCNPAQTVELCELAPNQLRLTGILPLYSSTNCWYWLGADGSVSRTVDMESLWFKATLNGFDTNNNPIWNPQTLIASATHGSTDPAPRCCGTGNEQTAISSNNILISFDQSKNNGWHLGGIQLGATNWLWKASPAANLNGCGTYEISNGVSYAGNTAMAVDRNVVYGFHGEFLRGQGEACQHMHFYDDGLFVGQFGEVNISQQAWGGAVAGMAGNGYSPCFMKTTNGDYYLWVNDESSHGPQRWHFVNARNIREQIGSGTLGGLIALTNQSYGFPSGVAARNGNQSGIISWLPVQGATSYNVYYSLLNGGPYSVLAGNTTNTNYLVGALSNGQTYFCAVTAIQSGAEGIPSEQVAISPFDTSQTVLCAGSLTESVQGTPIIDINSSALSSNQPTFIGTEYATGVVTLADNVNYGYGSLMQESIGTQGYVIYDWAGAGSNLTNLSPSFTVTRGSGWVDVAQVGRGYSVNGVLGANPAMSSMANPIGAINIGVSDNQFHFLTVVSPVQDANPRVFTLGITSTNGASAQYSINQPLYGFSETFQFLFRGNITLQANATGGTGAVLQAIFLDNAAVAGMSDLPPIPSVPPSPPTDLRIISSASNAPTTATNVLVTGQTLSGILTNNFGGCVGFSFVCATNCTCRALGRWVVSGSTQTHVVALCINSPSTAEAYATVTTSGAAPGTYAYASLATPYQLTAGATYWILSQEYNGGDRFYQYPSNSITCSSIASSVHAVVSFGSLPAGLTQIYTEGPSSGESYGPLNMQFTVP